MAGGQVELKRCALADNLLHRSSKKNSAPKLVFQEHGNKTLSPRARSVRPPSLHAMVLRPLRKEMMRSYLESSWTCGHRSSMAAGLVEIGLAFCLPQPWGLAPVRSGAAIWPPTSSSSRFFLRKTTAALLGCNFWHAGRPVALAP
jgi:hypothetical protein